MKHKFAWKIYLIFSPQVGDLTVDQFARTEAIQCTEVFEFVRRLADPDFCMPSLQPYKFLHCQRLLECGLASRAQDYTRELADWLAARVAAGATQVETDPVPGWVAATHHLATRLKYLDPVYTTSAGEIADIPDPAWLAKLDEAVRSLQAAPTTEYTMAEESMQVVDQYPGWRWDGAQWVAEETGGWPGAGGQQQDQAASAGYSTLQEEYVGSLQGEEVNVEQQEAYSSQENYYSQQQQQDYTSQDPYKQEGHESPLGSQDQKASPEPPGGSSPEQEASPSHTISNPTPGGFLGFNPSSLPPVGDMPAFDPSAQRASFDPATLPPIPERRTSLNDHIPRYLLCILCNI